MIIGMGFAHASSLNVLNHILSIESNQCFISEQDREKEVTEILQVIKSLIVTDKDRVKPHGSMADSLEEAWNDLNEQLEGRRILLDTSVAFHQSVEQVSIITFEHNVL